MAAANTDKFMEVGAPGTATTLASPGYTSGVSTSITVGSTSNWPTATGIVFAIDESTTDSDGNEVRVEGTYNEFVGTVASATSITNVDYVAGDAERSYAAGATTRVYIPVSATRENRLAQGMVVEHNQDGTHAAVTATSVNNAGALTQTGVATFTTHLDVNDASSAIRDTSDNELVKFAKTAAAVNEVTVTNAATAGAPTISATGGDTNIALKLSGKGTGAIQMFVNGIDQMGAWQSWTPTLSGRFTDADWTKDCKFIQIGKTVFYTMSLLAADATPMAGGSANAIFTLPVTAAAIPGTDTRQLIGHCFLVDDSSISILAMVNYGSTTTGIITYNSVSGALVTNTAITSTAPFTWTTNDEISAWGFYQAA